MNCLGQTIGGRRVRRRFRRRTLQRTLKSGRQDCLVHSLSCFYINHVGTLSNLKTVFVMYGVVLVMKQFISVRVTIHDLGQGCDLTLPCILSRLQYDTCKYINLYSHSTQYLHVYAHVHAYVYIALLLLLIIIQHNNQVKLSVTQFFILISNIFVN